jgi:hypothetical protein
MSIRCLFGHDWEVIASAGLRKIEELAEEKLDNQDVIIEITEADLDKPSCCYMYVEDKYERVCLRCGKYEDQITEQLIIEYNKLVVARKRKKKAMEIATKREGERR